MKLVHSTQRGTLAVDGLYRWVHVKEIGYCNGLRSLENKLIPLFGDEVMDTAIQSEHCFEQFLTQVYDHVWKSRYVNFTTKILMKTFNKAVSKNDTKKIVFFHIFKTFWVLIGLFFYFVFALFSVLLRAID